MRKTITRKEAVRLSSGCEACEYALNYYADEKWVLFDNIMRDRICVSPQRFIRKDGDAQDSNW